MVDELQPELVVRVVLDGDDSPETATENVRWLLEQSLLAMVDTRAIQSFKLEVRS